MKNRVPRLIKKLSRLNAASLGIQILNSCHPDQKTHEILLPLSVLLLSVHKQVRNLQGLPVRSARFLPVALQPLGVLLVLSCRPGRMRPRCAQEWAGNGAEFWCGRWGCTWECG